MKIYIASRFNSRPRLREVRNRLVAGGVEVTSAWLDSERAVDPPSEARQHALRDLADIDLADMLVLDLLDGRGRRGGMMLEAGYARGIMKHVVVIGDADCIFTQLFERFDDWDQFIDMYVNMRAS